ncbi:MAG: class I SAM-dependent methyltransferase [Candidatus Hodarchaeota archaeon]
MSTFISAKKIVKYYENIFPSGYCRDVKTLRINETLLTLTNVKQKVICDVGCGHGYLTRRSVNYGSQRVIGIDISSSLIKISQKIKKARVMRQLSYIIASGEYLPLKNDVFDILFCSETIEHIPNIYKTVHEFYRVLVISGSLLISFPNYFNIYGLQIKLLDKINKMPKQIIEHRITYFFMRKQFEDAKFTEIKVQSSHMFDAIGLNPFFWYGIISQLLPKDFNTKIKKIGLNFFGGIVNVDVEKIYKSTPIKTYKLFPFNLIGKHIYLKAKK